MTVLRTASMIALLVALAACGDSNSQEPEADAETAIGQGTDEEHEEGGDEVEIDQADAAALGIEIQRASLSALGQRTELPAEIKFAADRVAYIAPRVDGVVRSLEATEGDLVEAGEVLAVLDSGRLAALMADYHGARAAERFADSTLARERELLDQAITSQAEFAEAEQEAAMATARREAAETALHAAGIDHDQIESLVSGSDGAAGRYRITSPIAGRVIERTLSLGQSVQGGTEGGAPAFVVADDSVVWADVQVYAADLGRIEPGAGVVLNGENGRQIAIGEVAFVMPQLSEGSRTATARVILENEQRALRPGQFVTASLETGSSEQALTVPKGAVVAFEGGEVVFVPTDHGFGAVGVETGRQVGDEVEIVSGLERGQAFVAEGAFTLKAELEKAGFGDGHGH
ncbi:efflux RND transporter periplasmic adaptor subunit [Parvularcula dongshanensis]|uniref:Cobalt-zinc-cadmium efflux system membrane fusion protein n=2 Tax=Parvularcula TaxID=208215 RepID=A0A840I7Y5_9PROT|nr:efflux RND transporter periplasmic adaptor subunit [Parvularcula dongshanensis]MBB4660218.1 cobalt-zinc-cadmium efflux system membrane fusion protein [Parvularcula dongshanensis]